MSRILKDRDNIITQNAWQTNVVTGTYHKGTDISCKNAPTDILAHSDGVVVGVVNNHNTTDTAGSSYGNYVKIKHPNGYYTLYAHLQSVYVMVGNVVTKGESIGLMGMTGRATGVHVHFEVFDTNNEKINPTDYIEGDLPNLPNGRTPNEETKPNVDIIPDTSLNVGDRVLVLNGYLTATSYGGGSHTAEYDGSIHPEDVTNYLIITEILDDITRPRPIHLRRTDERGGTPMGWASFSQIRKVI